MQAMTSKENPEKLVKKSIGEDMELWATATKEVGIERQ